MVGAPPALPLEAPLDAKVIGMADRGYPPAGVSDPKRPWPCRRRRYIWCAESDCGGGEQFRAGQSLARGDSRV